MQPQLSQYAVAVGNGGVSTSEYHFNLLGHIKGPENYTDLLNTLRTASEGDIINIHINSAGGSIGTTAQLVNNIEDSKATVVGHLEAECHSAATLIFLSCDMHVVYENTMSLYHQYTSGTWGEGHKMKADLEATEKWVIELSEKYYANFLTKKEFKKMNQGKDFYFTSAQVVERLQKHVAARAELKEQMEFENRQAMVEQARLIIEQLGESDDSGSDRKAKKGSKK